MIRTHKIFFLVLLVAMAGVGCRKDYLDINQTNPNQTLNPPLNGLLAAVTYESGLNVYRAGYFTSHYMQYVSSSNAASGWDIYDELDRSTYWDETYHAIIDARNMQQKAMEQNALHHVGVAKTLEAMNMSMLTAIFGDVPYSDAWNAENYFPKYDKAEDVFNASLRLLDEAIVEFNKPTVSVALDKTNDLIHGGNVSAWKKTAFALKARLMNRLSKTSTYNAAGILSAIDSSYKSNADDAQLTQFVNRSPWNLVAFNNANLLLDGWLSSTFVNALNGKTYGAADPRLPLIASITKFGDYRGTPNGAGRIGNGTSKEESYLSLTGAYSRDGAPLMLVTFAEVKMIEAEAALRAGNKQRAYTAYLAGISAHMDKLGVAAGDKAAYLARPHVAVGADGLKLSDIFREKYVIMFLHPEAWTDARRFDYAYKDFKLPEGALLDSFIRRQPYPNTEGSRNSGNVPEVGSLADRLWWDR